MSPGSATWCPLDPRLTLVSKLIEVIPGATEVLLSQLAIIPKQSQQINVYVSDCNVILMPRWKGSAILTHTVRQFGEKQEIPLGHIDSGSLVILKCGTRKAHTFTWSSGQASQGMSILRIEYSTTTGALKYIPMGVSELIINQCALEARPPDSLRTIVRGACLSGFILDNDKGPLAPLKQNERSISFALECRDGYALTLHFITSPSCGKLCVCDLESPGGVGGELSNEERDDITAFVGLSVLENLSAIRDSRKAYPESFDDEFELMNQLTDCINKAATLIESQNDNSLGLKILWHGMRMLCDGRVQGKSEQYACAASISKLGMHLGEYAESMGKFEAAATLYESLFLSIRDSGSHDRFKSGLAQCAAVAFSRSGEHKLAEIYYMESMSLKAVYEQGVWSSWSRLYLRMDLLDSFVTTRQLCVDTAFRTKDRTARIIDAARTGCISTLRSTVKSIMGEMSPAYLMSLAPVKTTVLTHDDDKTQAVAYVDKRRRSQEKAPRVYHSKLIHEDDDANERETSDLHARREKREKEENIRLAQEEQERRGKITADRERRRAQEGSDPRSPRVNRTTPEWTNHKKKKSKVKTSKNPQEKVISIANVKHHSEHLDEMEASRIQELAQRLDWVRLGYDIGGS
jgi:hypothetical protein